MDRQVRYIVQELVARRPRWWWFYIADVGRSVDILLSFFFQIALSALSHMVYFADDNLTNKADGIFVKTTLVHAHAKKAYFWVNSC